MTFITQEVRDRIGVLGRRVAANGPLTEDELRRFLQAAMVESEYLGLAERAGAEAPANRRATPLYTLHSIRRATGTPDPLDQLEHFPDWDGIGGLEVIPGLEPLDLELKRVLNGGTRARFFQLAQVGDVISTQSRYVSITERVGSQGPMVLADVETEHTNDAGQLLARVRTTLIYR